MFFELIIKINRKIKDYRLKPVVVVVTEKMVEKNVLNKDMTSFYHEEQNIENGFIPKQLEESIFDALNPPSSRFLSPEGYILKF